MVGDPRDRTAYAIAIASIGVALAALAVGICWLAVQHGADVSAHRCGLDLHAYCRPELSIHHDTPYVPDGLWIAVAALGGILVGALIPSPLWSLSGRPTPRDIDRAWHFLTASVLVSLGIGAVLVAAIFSELSLPAYAVLVSAAGVLLGLPIPSPGRGES